MHDAISATPPALRLVGVGKRFETPQGELVAVRDVSFDVQPGEFISIIGPSGCGKTTLFNIVGGLLGNFEGQVMFDGKAARPQRRAIGMVFQEESALPWRTILAKITIRRSSPAACCNGRCSPARSLPNPGSC